MSNDQLRGAFDAIRTRLQAELDSQLSGIEERHAEAVRAARQEAEAQAEQHWSAKIDELRAEWAARLESEMSAAVSQAEQQGAAEAARLRTESESAIERARQEARRELEQLQAERERLHQELQAAVERGRQELDAEREQARQALDAERERGQQAVEAAKAALRAELDRETERVRQESETARAEAAASLDAERQRVRGELEAARGESTAQLEVDRRRIQVLTTALAEAEAAAAAAHIEIAAARAAEESARDEARASAVAAADAQSKPAAVPADDGGPVLARLNGSLRALAAARSLSDTLGALVAAAAAEAPRVALFVVKGGQLQRWKSEGFGPALQSAHVPLDDHGVLGEAVKSAEAASTAQAAAPVFAALPPDRAGVAVPVTVGGQTVAVLYADDADGAAARRGTSWVEGVKLLGRHASVCLAHLTAVRTAQAMRATPAAVAAHSGTASTVQDDDGSARRYARLLVSEIKLYNEGAVRVGREKRDLLHRLGAEIERARRLYEERVPQAVGARGEYFHQELVQTLADGDPALLGTT